MSTPNILHFCEKNWKQVTKDIWEKFFIESIQKVCYANIWNL